jgi:DMSO/TMAO reductase YedYZ molybdopterin-dependent catalytic subunit
MKSSNKRIGIHKLYHQDPLKADKLIWGRVSYSSTRRGFLRGSGLAAIVAALGASIPFSRFMPAGLIPAAFANSHESFSIPGKEGLIVLNDRPLNAEIPAHLLDDDVTPAKHLFIRNNGVPPEITSIDPEKWTLEIAGESCLRPQSFTLSELKEKFTHHTYQVQLECGGNGRREFYPPASGNQWSTGAVGCPSWTGVRLKDVLEFCGIRDDAVYTGYYGADLHLSGDPKLVPISRGVPMLKALEYESLIAWQINGEPLPLQNGYPLRLVTGGWPASTSGKWLTRILVRDRIHDGEKMLGASYRVPCSPVAAGTSVPDDKMCIIESMPIKSLITFPKSGITHSLNERLAVRGHAWAGDHEVQSMFVSIDFGTTWNTANLQTPTNRLAWQHWQTELRFPKPGYYEIWARAVDKIGRSQPMVLPGWNPRGYLNNACHRIAVQIV